MSMLLRAALVAVAATAFATPTKAQKPETARPRVVLVHGAFADGSSWSKVIPRLAEQGLDAVAVQNPLTSLEDDVAAARRAIEASPGPVILVGHSWAGTVITEVGNHDKVSALVYVAAFAPSKGETTLDAVKRYPSPPGPGNFVKDAEGYLTLPAQAIERDFAQDVTPNEARLIAATQGPIRALNFEQKVSNAAWTAKPTWYIVAAKDRMIDPDAQAALARKLKARTTVVDTSHVPMVSAPDAVTEVIVQAARSATR